MLKKDVLDHYGTATAIADELDLSVQAICQWGDLVPPAQARRLHELTGGVLKYDPADYRARYPSYRFLPPAPSGAC